LENDAQPSESNTAAPNDKPAEAIPPSEEKTTIDAESKRKSSPDGKHPLEWGIAIMLFGTLIATAFAACYTRQQWITADDSEKRSLRAYVGVEDHKLSNIASGQKPHWEVVIKNFGQTPATDLSYWAYSIIDAVENPQKLVRQTFSHDTVLLPSDRITFINDVSSPLPEPAVNGLATNMRFYVYGVQYHDVFGVERCTKFRLMYGGEVAMRLSVPRMGAAPEGNEIDKNCPE
jgi:hypothetical protein